MPIPIWTILIVKSITGPSSLSRCFNCCSQCSQSPPKPDLSQFIRDQFFCSVPMICYVSWLLGLGSLWLQPTAAHQDQGVSFQIANRSHFQQIHQLLEDDFFPDEPLSRSSASSQSSYYWTWVWVERNLKKFQTVVALDQNGTVIGANTGIDEGEIKDDARSWAEKLWWEYQIHVMLNLKNFLGSFTPAYFGDNPEWAVYNKAAERLGYNATKLMEELDCDRLYNLEFLSVSRTARGMGLGTQLVRVGEEQARARGCGCARVFASSKYSARIFRKLGWTQTASLKYEDFRNEEGELFVTDTREHTEMVTFSKILK